MSELICEWDIDVSACCPPGDETDEVLVASVVAQSSALMTRLSGYRLGSCPATLRPLSDCAECRTHCCGGADGLRLEGPSGLYVQSVTQVRDGATVVATDTYSFDVETQTLWRVPTDRWPRRDARWAACGTADAFCVDVLLGDEPDAYDVSVANTLACELLKSCTNQKCRLPKNTVNVTGQGITINMSDDDLLGLLPDVAAWARLVNPLSTGLPSRMWSPELDRKRGSCCGR